MANSDAAAFPAFNIEEEVKKMCRICLRESLDGKVIDLSCESQDSKKALENIYLCFQIILSFDKYLPTKVCEMCMLELNMANSFRLKCISFEERYEMYFKQMSTDKHIIDPSHLSEEIIDTDGFDEINNPVSCDLNDQTDSPDTSKKYVFEKQLNNTSNYKCDVCEKVLKSKASLLKHNISMHQKRKHMQKVTGYGSSRRYHCTRCSYSTPYSQTLVNHIRRHDGERPYQCKLCGKTFTQSSSFEAHKKTHSDKTYFTCSVCGKQFKYGCAFKNHLRVHENGSFKCDICQKVIKFKHTMIDHMNRHYNIRNYNCEHCGDTFVSSSELLHHKKKHGREKTLECHLCEYKTNTKKNLVIHLKRHAGEKRFKCNTCEEVFYTLGDLQRHRRVHTREKPFSCPTCSQRFTHSPSLNKHMQTVHGIDYKWGKEMKKLKKTNQPIS